MNGLEWLALEMHGRGGQRIQRRETGKAEKGQGAKDLEMRTQKFDLHSDGTWVIMGQ